MNNSNDTLARLREEAIRRMDLFQARYSRGSTPAVKLVAEWSAALNQELLDSEKLNALAGAIGQLADDASADLTVHAFGNEVRRAIHDLWSHELRRTEHTRGPGER